MTEEEKQKFRVPMWCPICEHPMKNGPGGDNKTYFKWGCCRHCHVEFIEDRESRWESGWRPSAEDVVAFDKKLYGRG